MHTPTPTPEGSLPPQAHSRHACVGCGYDLAGLANDACCPECSTPVARSRQGGWLLFASPHFLRSVVRGSICIEVGVLASLVWFFADDSVSQSGLAGAAIATLVSGAIVACTVTGYWLFTTPEPAFELQEASTSARRVLRIASVVYGVSALVATLDAIFGSSTSLLPGVAPAWGPLLTLSVLVQVASWAFVFFAAMLYVAWLARRVPDPALAQRSSTYMWVLPVLMVPLFCTCVGPLCATILYVVHIDHVRRAALQCVRAQQIASAAASIPQTSENPPPS